MNVVDLKKDEPAGPFAVGAVVQLNSGGAPMTVRSVVKIKGGATMVKVDWTDAAGNPYAADYDARQLQAPLDEDVSSHDD